MTITKDENGIVNQFAKEPPMETVDETYRPMVSWDKRGETLNGRLAMMGVVAALGAYSITGQIIPGVW